MGERAEVHRALQNPALIDFRGVSFVGVRKSDDDEGRMRYEYKIWPAVGWLFRILLTLAIGFGLIYNYESTGGWLDLQTTILVTYNRKG